MGRENPILPGSTEKWVKAKLKERKSSKAFLYSLPNIFSMFEYTSKWSGAMKI